MMNNNIKVLFLNYNQTEIEKIQIELKKLNYNLLYKIVSNESDLETEIKNNTYNIITITQIPSGKISGILHNTSPQTKILIISNNKDSEFIKAVFKSGRYNLVSKESIYEIALALINKFEKSNAVKQLVGSTGSFQSNTDEQFQKLKAELEEKNKELETVVYVTSHDIRSPVVNILGFSDEIAKVLSKLSQKIFDQENEIKNKEEIENLLNRDIPQMQNFIKQSGEKIEKQLMALLKLSRLGRAEITNANIDINEIIEIIRNELSNIFTDKNIDIQEDSLPACYADGSILKMVFFNIIENAVNFNESQDKIIVKVSAEQKNECVTYSITDNGIGMMEEELSKIFDVFYKINPEKSSGEGIGLTLVKKAIEMLNGKIDVKSKIGIPGENKNGETTFFITLPKQRE